MAGTGKRVVASKRCQIAGEQGNAIIPITKTVFYRDTPVLTTLFRPRRFYFPTLSLHSPRCDVRGEADHKRADEGADLLGGPQPPPLLLVQTFLSHTGESTQAPLSTQGWRYRPGTHADIVKRSV